MAEVTVLLSLPTKVLLPTGCMLLEMSELYPLGAETAMFRALPVDVHLTLNVDVPMLMLIVAVTAVTGEKKLYREHQTLEIFHLLG